ncbi:HD domain-containing protein [Streptomyces sp. NPDC047999]|uniref:HD domain-containing protein n=1 Tax=Streptomyces sp. NPDC047999 TaxID=3365497 RepID=UPI0037235CF9
MTPKTEEGPSAAGTSPAAPHPAAALPPLSALARSALQFARETEPAFLYAHSVRSYLFARALAEAGGLAPGADYDDELVLLGCVLHDVGLTAAASGHQRFEVEGADFAARFLRERGADQEAARVVWQVVALHTSEGIASRMGPEVAVAHDGIALDVLGRGRERLPAAVLEQVVAAYPRDGLAWAITDLIVDQALADPAKAGPLSFPGQVLRGHLPPGAVPGWHDLVRASPWGDRPPAAPSSPAGAPQAPADAGGTAAPSRPGA